MTAFAGGQFNRVPVINGSNHDEYRLAVAEYDSFGATVTAANYQSTIASRLDVIAPVAATIAAQYPLTSYPSPSIASATVGTDGSFACPAYTADRLLSKYVPTYAYEFNDENAPERYLGPAGFHFPVRRTNPRFSTYSVSPTPSFPVSSHRNKSNWHRQ